MAFVPVIVLAAAGCTVQASPTPATPMPTADGTPTTPGPTVSPAPELSWERVEGFPETLESRGIATVVAGGPGFVAVGPDELMGSLVWISTDGRDWTAVPQTPDFATAGIAALVAADGRVLAVGRETSDVDTFLAAAWISEDGTTWRRVEGGPDLQDSQLIDVVATDDGFVAIGGLPGADAAAVWTSADGETWQRVPDQPEFEHAFMWAVTEGGPGLVAVGWRRNPEPDLAVWTSIDGQEWTLAPDPPGGEGFQGRDVIELDGSLVMVGDLVFGGEAGAWVSPDGVTWEPAEADDSFAEALMVSVTTVPGGLMAVGSRGEDAGIWTSADGRSWTQVDGGEAFSGAFVSAAVALGGDVIAVGATQERIPGTGSFTSSAMVWYGSPVVP